MKRTATSDDAGIERAIRAYGRMGSRKPPTHTTSAGVTARIENHQERIRTAVDLMGPNSRAAAASDLECWLDWCEREAVTPLTPHPRHILRHLRHLRAQGMRSTTLKRRVASLARAYKILVKGYDHLPTDAASVRDLLLAWQMEDQHGNASKVEPETTHDPNELLAACGGDLAGLRDQAAVILHLRLDLKHSEATSACIENLADLPDGSAKLTLPEAAAVRMRIDAVVIDPDDANRLKQWIMTAGLADGPILRRIVVDKRRQSKREAANARRADVARRFGTPYVALDDEQDTERAGSTALTRQGLNLVLHKLKDRLIQGPRDVPGR
jgi:hypothetical protein